MFASAHPIAHATDSDAPPIRVLVVDDADYFREVVVACISDERDMEVVGEASDGPTAVTEAARLRPDVVLMDINLPGLSGVEATRQIVATAPRTWVIGLSMHQEADMSPTMRNAGARDYLPKGVDTEALLRAIRCCR